MRTIINYIRSCFCNHEWEQLPQISKFEPGETIPYARIDRWRCKRCGYIITSKVD